MKRMIFLFSWELVLCSTSCNESIVSKEDSAKARVLAYSCAGTVLQFIDTKKNVGEDWTYFENLVFPQKPSDKLLVYKYTATAFGVPKSRAVIGDTLAISFQQITQPPGPRCALGFGSISLVNVTALTE